MRARFVRAVGFAGLPGFCLVTALVFTSCDRSRSQDHESRPDNPRNSHSATITWNASTSAVAGYNVYRSTPRGGVVKLTARPVTGTQYADKTVETGHTYIYFVTSVDSKGFESRPSEAVMVTVPPAPGVGDTEAPSHKE